MRRGGRRLITATLLMKLRPSHLHTQQASPHTSSSSPSLHPTHPHSSPCSAPCPHSQLSPYPRLSPPSHSKRVLSSSMESHPQHPFQCSACGERKSDRCFLVCPSCKALQQPDPSINLFHIFDLDPKYELDLVKLETRYKDLMKKLHPDLYHMKSQEEQANSAILSATVTRAYQELLKPVSRATYMLQLQGIHVEEEGTVDDAELLMEVMDMREALEETSDPKTLEQLYSKAKSGMIGWEKCLVTAFNEGKNDAAVSALQRISYYDRLSEAIKRKML